MLVKSNTFSDFPAGLAMDYIANSMQHKGFGGFSRLGTPLAIYKGRSERNLKPGDTMQKPRIIRSQVEPRGVVVEWSDGIEFVFSADLNIVEANLLDDRREAVSRTSAQIALRGCGVQNVSRL